MKWNEKAYIEALPHADKKSLHAHVFDTENGIVSVPVRGGIRIKYRGGNLPDISLRLKQGSQFASVRLPQTDDKYWRWMDIPLRAFKTKTRNPLTLSPGLRLSNISVFAWQGMTHANAYFHIDEVIVYSLPRK